MLCYLIIIVTELGINRLRTLKLLIKSANVQRKQRQEISRALHAQAEEGGGLAQDPEEAVHSAEEAVQIE